MPSFVGRRLRRRALVVAGTDHRVQAQADGRARCATPDSLDLADGIEVDVHAGTEDDIEVALGGVRPGVGDLGGRPALRQAPVRPRRANRRRCRAEAELTCRGRAREGRPGSPAPRLALRAKRRRWSRPARSAAACIAREVLTDTLEVVNEARRATGARAKDLRVSAGDDQAPLDGIEARSTPPVGRGRRPPGAWPGRSRRLSRYAIASSVAEPVTGPSATISCAPGLPHCGERRWDGSLGCGATSWRMASS